MQEIDRKMYLRRAAATHLRDAAACLRQAMPDHRDYAGLPGTFQHHAATAAYQLERITNVADELDTATGRVTSSED